MPANLQNSQSTEKEKQLKSRFSSWGDLLLSSMKLLTVATASVISFPATTFAAQVIAIADGDTLTVLEDQQQIKIRLANIDAPEKKQPFGQRSRQSLADLCFGKDAEIRPQNTDRYGRTVAVVICDGVEANREQVERGLAWVYPKYNRDRGLPAVEHAARDAKLGMWRDQEPVPPWEWRKRQQNLATVNVPR